MRNITKLVLLAFSLCLFGVTLTGCNTAKGFGKDVESTGDAIQRNIQ